MRGLTKTVLFLSEYGKWHPGEVVELDHGTADNLLADGICERVMPLQPPPPPDDPSEEFPRW